MTDLMQLVAKMPEPTDEQKRAIAEANTPEGWQRAFDAVDAEVRRSKSGAPLVGCRLAWTDRGNMPSARRASAFNFKLETLPQIGLHGSQKKQGMFRWIRLCTTVALPTNNL